jgi:hypothetical protein
MKLITHSVLRVIYHLNLNDSINFVHTLIFAWEIKISSNKLSKKIQILFIYARKVLFFCNHVLRNIFHTDMLASMFMACVLFPIFAL